MVDIITIGELLIDMIGQEQTSLDKIKLFKRFPGGAPANVAVGIARLGGNVGMISRVGNDFFGDFLVSKLRKEGVDVSQISIDPKFKTGIAWVGLDDEKKPTFAFHRSPCADLKLNRRNINSNYIEKAKFLHYGTVSMTEEPARSTIFHVVKLAHKYGIIISCDPNFRADLWKNDDPYSLLLKILPKTHILKISLEDAMGLTGETSDEAFHQLLKLGPKILLFTMGEKGSKAITGKKEFQAPAYDVNVVDTTGAGDAFMAGFLYSYLQLQEKLEFHQSSSIEKMLEMEEIQDCLSFGNKVACLSLLKMGAMSALPRMEEIKQFNFHQFHF